MGTVLTISSVSTAADTLTITAHGRTNGDGPAAIFTPDGVLPTPLAAVTDYWLIVVDANTVKLATSSANALAGTAIDITAAGSGTLQLLIGLPYRRPRTYAALSQLKSADMNEEFDANVALWNFLTGQSQSAFGAGIMLKPQAETRTLPLMRALDWQGNARATLDHLGFRGGQLSEWEEHWRLATVPAGWTWAVAGAATVAALDPDATLNQRYAQMTTPNGGSTTNSPLYTARMDADTQIVAEWIVRIGAGVASDASNTFHDFGFQLGSAGSDDDFFLFRHKADNANWRAIRAVNNVVQDNLDTTIAAAVSSVYRMRLEIIGSALYSGGGGLFFARFFLNGVLRNTIAFTAPAADKIRFFFRSNNAQAANCIWDVGRVRMQWNHFRVPDAL